MGAAETINRGLYMFHKVEGQLEGYGPVLTRNNN